MNARLRIFDGLPSGLLDCDSRGLAACLGGPALIRVRGHRSPPLFVSVLLHGNETSGWAGVRRLLRDSGILPRNLTLFIGNVEAAAAGVRTLPHQQDYNRIWRDAVGPDAQLAAAVQAELSGPTLFAALDLHNNTGHNPHYAVVTDLRDDNLGLAYLFDDKAVYVREPDTVMTRIFAGVCPAVTLELGPIGDPRCDERAYDIVRRCLALDAIPPADLVRLQTFRAEARVHVPEGIEFSFAGQDEHQPLVLTGGLEAVNFHELLPGTEFALTRGPGGPMPRVLDVAHRDVTAAYFANQDGHVRLRRAVIPAMYTTDPEVIRQDCLCYFMVRMNPRTGLLPGTTAEGESGTST